ALETSDLAGCALDLVDRNGQGLGLTFGLPPGTGIEQVLPRNNVFGLSNSAFRSESLQRCLPIPAGVVLVDWFLATQAWLTGARLTFDPVARMDYRQHETNLARVTYPVWPEQGAGDTELVRRYFEFVLGAAKEEWLPERLAQVEKVAAEVAAFDHRVVRQPTILRQYVDRLNEINPAPLWWSCVAHPALGQLWLVE